ncbi:MAG: DUF1016 N-terminal domain-containing protein [Spirochaetia bacterium]|jgi:predicted nuclease of restriction endonuclease-like (RecB) superfamily|nr:DUF1016 N-terminal domain-containing protein [Spirochaetia bacterium]
MKNKNELLINTEYSSWLKGIKEKIRSSQIKAAVKVNSTLLEFYWDLGADIAVKQKEAVWGSGFLEQLSQDLSDEFSDMKSFSYRNIKFIRQWYGFYSKEGQKRKQLVSQLEDTPFPELFKIPWGQNLQIIKDPYNFDFLTLPEELQSSLPSIEEIEAELGRSDEVHS